MTSNIGLSEFNSQAALGFEIKDKTEQQKLEEKYDKQNRSRNRLALYNFDYSCSEAIELFRFFFFLPADALAVGGAFAAMNANFRITRTSCFFIKQHATGAFFIRILHCFGLKIILIEIIARPRI